MRKHHMHTYITNDYKLLIRKYLVPFIFRYIFPSPVFLLFLNLLLIGKLLPSSTVPVQLTSSS